MALFSKNLRFLRKKGEYNQEIIAALFNKKANTIGNWENEKSEPNLSELMKLGEFFRVSTEDLLHIDMEKYVSPPLSSYDHPAREASNVNEDKDDNLWSILKEIRALNDKVDILMAGMDSTMQRKNSDKSYH